MGYRMGEWPVFIYGVQNREVTTLFLCLMCMEERKKVKMVDWLISEIGHKTVK